jgi:hypothetical protein
MPMTSEARSLDAMALLGRVLRDVGTRYKSPTTVDAGEKLLRTADEDRRAMNDHPEPRRFPPPWTVTENAESFVVKDAKGRPLGYFYFEDEPVRRGLTDRLTKVEAWRMAVNFAKLPDLLGKAKT